MHQDLPCADHKQSQSINTVGLKSYLREVPLSPLITFLLSILNETPWYNNLMKNECPSSWLGTRRNVWLMEQCSTGHRWFDPSGQKSQGHDDFWQGLKTFFHCEDFINWVYKLNLSHALLLALKLSLKGTAPTWWGLWHWCQLWFASATEEDCLHLCGDSSGQNFPWPQGFSQIQNVHPHV